MTDKQPEALRLADALTKHLGGNTATQAAAELRRLHELNDDLYQQGVALIARIEKLETLNRELLKALKHAVKLNGFREFNDHIPTMKAAIAKAQEQA